MKPQDAGIRERALDPHGSFIVQAPAGSGKTELLTRRVLTLLAGVDEPEEILAITFTRKAASEMRHRVIEMLRRATTPEPPASEYEAEGLALARAALERDRIRGWQLLRNPQRLNLRTIDSLSTQLAHRLPVLSTLGAPAGVMDDARVLYREAAAGLLEANPMLLDQVLLQLGNRLESARALLADMLANRDQWTRYLGQGLAEQELREALEGMLCRLVEVRLQALCDELPVGLSSTLTPLIQHAVTSRQVLAAEPAAKVKPVPQDLAEALLALEHLPGAQVDDLPCWQAIAELLLTQTNSVRRAVKRGDGFPTSKADAALLGRSVPDLTAPRDALVSVLQQLEESPELAARLAEVRGLPLGGYRDDEWALLAQLLGVLPHLIAELQLTFAKHGRVDFLEIAARARQALGTADEPTDLALAMDLRLRHLLVDEFQDTSLTQFQLFEMLVAGWADGDGHTFFAVGDPMQSIYRFRDADVGLFSQARDHGLAAIQLEPLTLTVNFRAAPAVIDWVNDTFADIFPDKVDTDIGAVPYSPSTAFLDGEGGVSVHPHVQVAPESEAATVAQLAADAIAGDESHTVAILVRSRPQASLVFTALQARGVAYESVDMDLLGERAVVRDLLALCLALRYPHDRLHWLAVLRAPWCALTLSDLLILMQDSEQRPVFDLITDPARSQLLSSDGQHRIERLLGVLEPAVRRAPRAALVPWVEACWLQLAGPLVCVDAMDLDAAERCLTRLQELESAGQLWQPSVLQHAMETLYAAGGDGSGAQVQVMTMHKSKGLEFDTVIVPAMGRKPRLDSKRLLDWFESTLEGETMILLAPFTERDAGSGAINQLVGAARARCDEQEILRLLYVACTRAKRHLHLVGTVAINAKGDLATPVNRSLLLPLWTRVEAAFEALAAQGAPEAGADPGNPEPDLSLADDDVPLPPPLQRLPLDWQMPAAHGYQWPDGHGPQAREQQRVEFQWASPIARDVGTVVHRQLQRFAELPDVLEAVRQPQLAEIVHRQLRHAGVPTDRLEEAGKQVLRALERTAADERGRWILSPDHESARSEWALTATDGTGVRRIVIDRTFVVDGVRWIIDFKTGDHTGGDLEAFLDREQDRYADQLATYADIIRGMENRPVRTGLYFPLLQGWREIVCGPDIAVTTSTNPVQEARSGSAAMLDIGSTGDLFSDSSDFGSDG